MNKVSNAIRTYYYEAKQEHADERARLGITEREAVLWDRVLMALFIVVAGGLLTMVVLTADNGIGMSLSAFIALLLVSLAFLTVGDKIRQQFSRIRVFTHGHGHTS